MALVPGWALSLAMSRSFGLKAAAVHAMTPLIDMADHSFDSNSEIRSDADGAVTMMANKQAGAWQRRAGWAWLGVVCGPIVRRRFVLQDLQLYCCGRLPWQMGTCKPALPAASLRGPRQLPVRV